MNQPDGSPRPPEDKTRETLDSISAEHADQFDKSVSAAMKRGFMRWFDDTWLAARGDGVRANPFISSMFVFITTMLTKKFVAGLPNTLSAADRERAVVEAMGVLHNYLDQIEVAAIKDVHNPKPTPTPQPSKQTIILPKKRIIQ
jgi:3-oxoacyl-ACP reductase-like protein